MPASVSLKSRLLLSAGLAVFAMQPVQAQQPAAFPTKAVRIYAAYPPGSGPDAAMRLVAEQLSKKWGQPVVVENRPGGNGFIAINALKQAAADGHELIEFDMTHVTTHPHTFSRLPYDPRTDLELIRPLFQNEFFFVVAKDSPLHTVDDIVAAARAKPGQVSYGSWFNGSPGHLGGLRLQHATGTQMPHIPYKETSQLYGDVATQQVQWALGSAATAGPLEKAGKVRFIASTGTMPSSIHPQLPLASASPGLGKFNLVSWVGLAAPKGTPRPVRDKISRDLAEALASASVRERYRTMGYDLMDLGPDEFAAHVERERQVWGQIIASTGLKLD